MVFVGKPNSTQGIILLYNFNIGLKITTDGINYNIPDNQPLNYSSFNTSGGNNSAVEF